MARTFTADQRAAIAAAHTSHSVKLELEDPDGNYTDVSTALDDPDWLTSVTLEDDIDANCITMQATLLRDTGIDSLLSLAPLRTDSTLNVDSLAAYAPFLDVARKWRVSVSVQEYGDAHSYTVIGEGLIDTITINDPDPTITITGRDLGASLLDCWIDTERTYSPTSADAMEDVIQDMLDDNLTSPPTLYCPVSPSFVMNKWEQQKESLMVAINKVASLAGMVVRYRYDSADTFRLTLYAPDRTAGAGDEEWTLGPTEYTRLPVAKIDIAGVRNEITLQYFNSATGAVATHTESDATSIARYGGPHAIPRTLEIDLASDANVTTSARANTLAEAILSDLKNPNFDQVIEAPGFWIAQLGDYGAFTANSVHYDTDQYAGVTHLVQHFERGELNVTLSVRGQPSTRYKTWVRDTTARVPSTIPLICRAKVQSTSSTSVTFRVAVADPIIRKGKRAAQLLLNGQGDISVAAVVSGCTLVTSSPQTITATNVTSDIDTTGTVDFQITRAAFQSGTGRIAFTATRVNRAAGTDGGDVPCQERDTQTISPRILRVSETRAQVVVRVMAITPNAGATCTVAYDAAGLTISPSSGGTFTSTTSFGTTNYIDYTIDRDSVGGTPRRVAFTISASGFTDATDGVDVVPNSTRFRVQVKKTGNQSINNATITALTFDAEDFDSDALHDNSTNNSRITVPTGGDVGAWFIIATVVFAASGAGTFRYADIIKNGATIIASINVAPVNSGGRQTILQLSAIESAPTVGDYYECRVEHDVGAAHNVETSFTRFAAVHNP